MKIFFAAATLFAGTLASNVVLAACDPPAGDNVTATCSGTTVNQNGTIGYGGILFNNLNVTVTLGSSVTGTNYGVGLRTGPVQNSGTIAGSNYGVFSANSLNLKNSGQISGGT